MSYLGREAAKAPIVTADLPNDGVSLAKMTGGTDGQIITYDASGDPVAVGPGTDGQVLTSTGAGSPPAFEAATGGVTGWDNDNTTGNNDLLPDSASAGIYLGVNSATAANLLDDYEEGTWTPTNSAGITGEWGEYTKIGNMVTVTMAATNSGSATAASWGGLPYTSYSTADRYQSGAIGYNSEEAATWNALITPNTTGWTLRKGSTSQSISSTNVVRMSITYLVA